MKGSTTPGFGPNAASATALCHLSLANSARAKEKERPDQPARFVHSHAHAFHSRNKQTHSVGLVDHPRIEIRLDILNRLSLAARVLRGMNTRQFTGKAHTHSRALRIIGSRAHHAVTDILRNEAPYWTGALCPLVPCQESGEGIEYRRFDAQIDAPLAHFHHHSHALPLQHLAIGFTGRNG